MTPTPTPLPGAVQTPNSVQVLANAVFNLESIIYLQGSTLTPEAHKVMVETIENLKALYK